MKKWEFAELLNDLPDDIISAAYPTKHKESRVNHVMLWACGIAACAVVGFTAVMIASHSGNMTQPENNAGGSVPIEMKTDSSAATSTTAELIPTTQTGRDIAFSVSAADYQDDEGFLSLNEQEALKSRVIRSADALKSNRIQPVKAYTDEYFNDHALIFVSTVFSCTGDLPEVTKVHNSGNTIEIMAEREPAMDEALQWWCTFIEVDKSEIPNGEPEIILHSDMQIKPHTETQFMEHDIPFTLAEADYKITDSSIRYSDLKNTVFFDNESLKRSYVHPSKEYDDAFFHDHALLFVTYVFSTMNQHETAVSNVHLTENLIEVNAVRERNVVEAAAVQWWCTFIEIDRTELEGHRAYDNVILNVTEPFAAQSGTNGQPDAGQTTETTAIPVTTQPDDSAVTTAISFSTDTTAPNNPQTTTLTTTREQLTAEQLPYSFVIRMDDEYDDELNLESGVEWLTWYESAKKDFYCAAKGEQQDKGLAYALAQPENYDMLWFKMEITGDCPEVRKISLTQNGKLTVETAMVRGELDAGVYRVCVPVPHSDASLEDRVSIWELQTISDTAESGILPQITAE